jgi:pyruvate,water dikinase
MSIVNLSSGIVALDEIVQGLRLGDNVVWKVDRLADYAYFAEPFVRANLQSGQRVTYVRFAEHPPVVPPLPGLEILEVDPREGFDHFSRAVHELIAERGRYVCYVFDNLSSLVNDWATDELLANFFQLTCPFLFELETIAYFALTRGLHAHSAVARIRDTTQLLLDTYHVDDRLYLHPLKVWDRYSQQMFLPHLVAGEHWTPVAMSGDAAGIVSQAKKFPLRWPLPSIAPWESVYHKLLQHCGVNAECREDTPELQALKYELIHMLLGGHPEFERLARHYLVPEDLIMIRERLIGSGRIGGKAAGMLLARRILRAHGAQAGVQFAEVLEEHDSFFIGSDVFYTFLVTNDLFRLRLDLMRNTRLSAEEFAVVESRFLAGSFPPAIVEQFRSLLEYYGQAPIIVRSSSLLEDNFGNAFAGKYRSEFCPNQGDPDDRLEAFLCAIKQVYASALNPHVLSYRRKRGLGESDEQMAVLVQRVSGMPQGHYFFPVLAGVAFSRNLYAWSERIDPNRGVIRLVYGLGTRAVDRVDLDYPRMIAMSNPGLRPEIGLKIKRYSQRQVDVLDLTANETQSLPVAEALAQTPQQFLYYLVSQLADGGISDPISSYLDVPTEQMVVTFNNLIRRTPFAKVIEQMLVVLEAAYGHPVDIEFTAVVDARGQVRINLLQCRPLYMPGPVTPLPAVDDLAHGCLLFRTQAMMNGGDVGHIRYLIYIDSLAYTHHTSRALKQGLGRLIGRLNDHPAVVEGQVMMIGPGRWGSSNLDLGVNVGYADISNAAVLVEMAREEAGQLPEVSYGTHFFLDLVESQIIFLAVYPDEPATGFNQAFFADAPNILTDLLPDAGDYQAIVQVIDVPQATDGHYIRVLADTASRRAVCLLEAGE